MEAMNWVRELISLPCPPPLPPSDAKTMERLRDLIAWSSARSMDALAADALAADGPPPAAPAVPAVPGRRVPSRSRSARSAGAVTGAAAIASKTSGTTGASDGSAPARAAIAGLHGASDGAAAASSAMASGTSGASDGVAAASASMVSGTSAVSDGGAAASFARERLAAMVFQCIVVSAIRLNSDVPSSLLKAVASNRDVAFDLPTVQPETRDELETHCSGAIRRRSRALHQAYPSSHWRVGSLTRTTASLEWTS